MSADLEEVFNCINNAQVPPLWEKVSSSIQYIDAQLHTIWSSITVVIYYMIIYYSCNKAFFLLGLSFFKTIGCLDSWFGDKSGAICQLGSNLSSSSVILVIRVHISYWFPHSCSTNCSQEEQCRLWVLLVRQCVRVEVCIYIYLLYIYIMLIHLLNWLVYELMCVLVVWEYLCTFSIFFVKFLYRVQISVL